MLITTLILSDMQEVDWARPVFVGTNPVAQFIAESHIPKSLEQDLYPIVTPSFQMKWSIDQAK